MAEIRQHDFGLKEFIEKYNCDVSERYVNGKIILTLVPHPDPNPTDWYGLGIDVILFEERILGAKARLYHDGFTAAIVGEQVRGYSISESILFVGTQAMVQKNVDFQDFLGTAHSTYNKDLPVEPNDVCVDYIRMNGLFIPRDFSFGEYGIFIEKVPFKYRKNGNTYTLSKDHNMLTATKEDESGIIRVSFPESISSSKIRRLEQILRTDTDWLELPRQIPILYYSMILQRR